MKIRDLPLAELIAEARRRAAIERHPYDQRELPAILDRLCDELEARIEGDRASIRVRLQEAARMRRAAGRGEAL